MCPECQSGEYKIFLDDIGKVPVFCDMHTDGGKSFYTFMKLYMQLNKQFYFLRQNILIL